MLRVSIQQNMVTPQLSMNNWRCAAVKKAEGLCDILGNLQLIDRSLRLGNVQGIVEVATFHKFENKCR
jgi:hypothetical protein